MKNVHVVSVWRNRAEKVVCVAGGRKEKGVFKCFAGEASKKNQHKRREASSPIMGWGCGGGSGGGVEGDKLVGKEPSVFQ